MTRPFTIQHLQELKAAGKIRDYQVVGKAGAQMPAETKKSKYGNKKVVIDNISFDSTKEGDRYRVLKLLQKQGIIGMLQLQVPYELKVNGELVCRYIADFQYIDSQTGNIVVEDVKSKITRKLPVYRLKKKLMKQIHNIKIKEV